MTCFSHTDTRKPQSSLAVQIDEAKNVQETMALKKSASQLQRVTRSQSVKSTTSDDEGCVPLRHGN